MVRNQRQCFLLRRLVMKITKGSTNGMSIEPRVTGNNKFRSLSEQGRTKRFPQGLQVFYTKKTSFFISILRFSFNLCIGDT